MERVAAGVAPEAAVAWWSDFREGDVDHAFLPGAKRRILGHSGGEVTMEDRMGVGPVKLFFEQARARVDGRVVRFSGTNTFATFEGSYSFVEAPAGTLVRLDAMVRLRKGLRWSEAVARRVAEVVLRQDLRHHVEEMERDLARRDGKKSP